MVGDLQLDAAHVSADHGLAFPETFRDGEAEALAGRLLDDDVGHPLKGIDCPVNLRRQLKDVNVGVVPGGLHHLVKDLLALRVVRCPPAGKNELHGQHLPDQAGRPG